MPDSESNSQHDAIELEVRRQIAAEVATYRKNMEDYSSTLTKAADSYSLYLEKSTRWLLLGFAVLAASATTVFSFFMGQSIESAKTQIPSAVASLVPVEVANEVKKLGVVNQANSEIQYAIDSHKARLQFEALKAMEGASVSNRNELIEKFKINAAALKTELTNELFAAASTFQQTLTKKAADDLKKAVELQAKLIVEGPFKQDVEKATQEALLKIKSLSEGEIKALLASLTVPAGTIAAYGGSNLRELSGWLLCDGQPYRTNEFPNLFAAIRFTWGRGNEVSEFRVPDLQGQFLRGVDSGGRVDLEANSRTNSQGQIVGSVVGSFQSDDLKSHNHSVLATGGGGDKFAQALRDDGDGRRDLIENQLVQPRGGLETRPKNAAVYYIIKY